MSLNAGANISGQVTDSVSGAPIVDVTINVYNHAGIYHLSTATYDVLVDMKYGNTPCFINSCNVLDSIPIILIEGQAQTNADFLLKSNYIFGSGF